PSSHPSTRPPRPTGGWRGSWSPVAPSPDAERPAPADGRRPEPADGRRPEPVEGRRPEPVDGRRPEPAEGRRPEPAEGFRVSVGVFDGPFDLLLTLLSKHELDITDVALSQVTGEFIAYLKELGPDEELEEASEF